ncbi:MAG: type III pantothenate kinase [Firmicutes bacterium]|nr:type III pantothenate kinase [Bacillota bacterium]
MILAIDIGNTNVKIGAFDGDRLAMSWRMAADGSRTADEYGAALLDLLAAKKFEPGDIKGIGISSVIPGLNYTFDHMCKFYFDLKPLFIGPGVKTGLNVKYDNPKELGSDRIAASVAAICKVGCPCIILDLGTATTVNVIGAGSAFLGGAIFPGLKSSMDTLVNTTARLPKIELARPENVVGKTTAANMQSGLYHGFIGMIEHMVARMKEECGIPKAKVVATGGLFEFVQPGVTCVDLYDRTLSLRGVYEIYRKNQV